MRNTKVKRKIDANQEDGILGEVDYVELGDFIKMMLNEDNEKIIKYFGNNFGVFYYLMGHVNWNTGYVSVDVAIKKDVAEKVGISDGMVDKHLKVFKELNLIKKVYGTTCMVNPIRFFSGDGHLQKEMIRKFVGETWKGDSEK